MRRQFSFIPLLFVLQAGMSQVPTLDSWRVTAKTMAVDSLEILLTETKSDRIRTLILSELGLRYAFNEPEKGLIYGEQGLALAEKLEFKYGTARAYEAKVYCLWAMGNYSKSLQLALETLRQYEDLEDPEGIAWMYLTIGIIYNNFGDLNNALVNVQKGKRMYDSLQLSMRIPFTVIGATYEALNQSDSALFYIREALILDSKETTGWGWLHYLMGNIQAKKRNYDSALASYRQALPLAISANIRKDVVDINNGLARVFKELGRVDSSIFYAKEVFQKWNSTSYKKGVLDAVNILAEGYKSTNQRDSLIKYLELSVVLNKTLFNQEKEREIQQLAFSEQRRRQEQADRLRRLQNRLWIYGLVVASVILWLVAFFLYRNNRYRQKAFLILQKQQKETDVQKEKAEHALKDLKAAQSQLIQSEKMASLGELTAGIAHEIENPLNFVNNFSEVSNELMDELKTELATGNGEQAVVLANDIKENLEKINHHGKRADAIVKSMLQHSRASSGKKEPTDINALCDEYLRLAYHGLRAKDALFKAKFKTDFEPSLPEINVVPQDIGRVLLNLINNAFYAVCEKAKVENGQYEPLVMVSTKKRNDKLEIIIKDNADGIPESIREKIFQPFFTTKPAGQGTGLGLSLAYDIITKGHGGSITVETSKLGTQFIIQLILKLP
jgi:two-component system NtrC family sensor kinase